METIKWYNSKTVWFNIIITVLGIITALQGLVELQELSVYFATILAIGNVILRVWFTQSSVE